MIDLPNVEGVKPKHRPATWLVSVAGGRSSNLRTIPDRTGLNAAHGTARPVAIAMAVIVPVIVIPPIVFAVLIVMLVVVLVVRVLLMTLAPHLHDVVRASELRQG